MTPEQKLCAHADAVLRFMRDRKLTPREAVEVLGLCILAMLRTRKAGRQFVRHLAANLDKLTQED